MKIETSRFGTVEASEDEIINFPRGLIGFPKENQYVLIPHATSSIIAWLQSVVTPDLAFPVVSAHGFVQAYPDVDLVPLARNADIGDQVDDLAILAVLSAPRKQPATVNLLAPVIINSKTRRGGQIFLEGSKFSTRELFIVPGPNEQDAAPAAEARVG